MRSIDNIRLVGESATFVEKDTFVISTRARYDFNGELSQKRRWGSKIARVEGLLCPVNACSHSVQKVDDSIVVEIGLDVPLWI
jgi:hypothetical protein